MVAESDVKKVICRQPFDTGPVQVADLILKARKTARRSIWNSVGGIWWVCVVIWWAFDRYLLGMLGMVGIWWVFGGYGGYAGYAGYVVYGGYVGYARYARNSGYGG